MEEGRGRRDDDRGGSARHPGRVAGRCTAVVPAWRAEATLLETLRSLVVLNGDVVGRVIVVGCTSDRCLDIARRFDGVEVVALAQRATAGRGRNVGRERAVSDLLLFVDADCVLEAGAAARLVGALESRGLDAAGAAIVQDGNGFVGWVRHLLEFKESAPGVPAGTMGFLPSTVLLVRAGVFDACGGFPDMWPGEDLVFAQRMRALGARLAKIDVAVARHTHPEGLSTYLAHEYRLGVTAARARVMADMHGAAFVGRMWLAPLLMCGRALRAAMWLLRYRPHELPRFVALLPLYLSGLSAWTIGFARVRRTGAAA
jgi:glycosyltransferase involved in cell wall biosynthesis